jgi:hypothetical protein
MASKTNGKKLVEPKGSLLYEVLKGIDFEKRELVNKLAETMTVENKPTSPGLLEKMKDLFN